MAAPSAPGSDGTVDVSAVLEALPGAVVVLDPVGTVLFATRSAGELIERPAAELVGESVLAFVDEDTAWTYAAAVAMASDYADVVSGPMRVTLVTPSGEHRQADLWAQNRLDDPTVAGIVCLLTPASTAMGLGEALQSLANGAALAPVATKVARALAGNPVLGDAAVLAAEPAGLVRLDAGPGWLPDDLAEGPWHDVISSGVRALCETVDELPAPAAAAAREAGFATAWVEPVGAAVPARGLLVVWRRRPGRPSPNQLNALHQAAAILAMVWDRHEALV